MATMSGEGCVANGWRGAASWMFTGAVLLSAALVFLIEPLLGRLLLPVLGGTAAVWTTSLAFFQTALLAGYVYAHLVQARLPLGRQVLVHLVLLAAAAACLPPRLPAWLGEPWSGAPAIWLAAALTVAAGLPFAALSATAPLVQAWCSRLSIPPPMGRSLYGLYAASNAGSLIGLIAYPVVVEPLLGLRHQAQLWAGGFVAFAALLLAAAWLARAGMASGADKGGVAEVGVAERKAAERSGAEVGPVSWRERAVWMALAAAPSSLLLGVTGHITTDVTSAPFLWVVPLVLYLLTFIIAFARPGAVGQRLLWAHLASVTLALMTFANPELAWPAMLAIHLCAFFTAALLCHKTLVARRPVQGRLTDFYLSLAAGGAIGGLVNALVCPLVLPDFWEYPAVLALTFLIRPREGETLDQSQRLWVIFGSLWVVPLWIPAVHPPGMIRTAMMLVVVFLMVWRHRQPLLLSLLGLNLVVAALAQQAWTFDASYRSFFGVTKVRHLEDPEIGPLRMLVHGYVLHGQQPLDPRLACRPTSYYAAPTAIGQVFSTEQRRKPAMDLAVMGLGAGVTADFVRAADRMTYFEVDPGVVRIAQDSGWFSLLRCAKGPVNIEVGDARLKLREKRGARYDLMLMDAFSSDSVPTHLLTTEAIKEALGHLKPDGVLLLHLSNNNLELTPTAAASARAAGGAVLSGVWYSYADRSHFTATSTIVLLVASNPRTLDRYRGRAGWTEAPMDGRPWTDDYSNLIGPFARRLALVDWWRMD